jgi:hypothetical protein
MGIQTFEYCSLQYLNQWLTYDREFCDALSGLNREDKLAALKRAGGFYRVARNLPREFDEEKEIPRFSPILDIIDEVDPNQFQKNTVTGILEIGKKISEKYGEKKVLSLTTKFLWLKLQSPIIIYDSQARIALGTKDGNLIAYYEEWLKNFKKCEDQIKQACAKLSDLHLHTVNYEMEREEYIKSISSERWFHERVFDIYLWNKGKNKMASTEKCC